MDQNKVFEQVKKIKNKRTAVLVITLLICLAVAFLLNFALKYLFIVLILIAGVFIIAQISDATYILYDDCDPQLYYAVTKSVLGQVDENKQVIVSEFIGDYSSATAISKSLLARSKNDLTKALHYSNIAKNAFMVGNFDLCRESIDSFNKLMSNKRINDVTRLRNEFYIAFTDGDFEKAKGILAQMNTAAKKQRNSFKCVMLYYNAIVDASLNDTASAKSEFEEIISNYPKMYLSQTAKEYLQNKKTLFATQSEADENLQSIAPKRLTKREKVKVIAVAVILLALVIVVPVMINVQTTAKTPQAAVEKFLESDDSMTISIKGSVDVDDDYRIYVYCSGSDSLGVAYVKLSGDKFRCMMANDDIPETNRENSTYCKIHASGNTKEILYTWLGSDENIPEGYLSLPVKYNGSTIYFCYKLSDSQKHFSNSFSLAKD